MKTKREIYQKKMKTKLDQINAQIDGYLAQFEETEADIELSVREQIDELIDQQNTVKQKFEEIKSSGQDAWDDVRSGLEDAIEELEMSYNKVVNKMAEVTQ